RMGWWDSYAAILQNCARLSRLRSLVRGSTHSWGVGPVAMGAEPESLRLARSWHLLLGICPGTGADLGQGRRGGGGHSARALPGLHGNRLHRSLGPGVHRGAEVVSQAAEAVAKEQRSPPRFG